MEVLPTTEAAFKVLPTVEPAMATEPASLNVNFPSGAKSEQFINQKGLRIVFHSWEVATPKAAVVGVHGVTSHGRFDWLRPAAMQTVGETEGNQENKGSSNTERKDGCKATEFSILHADSWVDWFNKKSISFYAIDMESHGESDSSTGYRCSIGEFDDVAVDVLQLLHIIDRKLDNESDKASGVVPLFLAGLSMGGCVTLRVAELLEREISSFCQNSQNLTADSNIGSPSCSPLHLAFALRGFVLLAPMLGLDTLLSGVYNKTLATLAPYFAAFVPNLPVIGLAKPLEPLIEVAYEKDLLTYKGKIRANIGYANMKALQSTLNDIGKIGETYRNFSEQTGNLPSLPEPPSFLFIHSKRDTMCDPSGSIKAMAMLDVKDKHLELLDGMWHCLTIEPGNFDVWSVVYNWMSDRLSKEKRCAAS